MATETKELVIETKETQLEEVDAPKGKAKFKDCMLELTLPKKSAKRHNLKIE